MKRFLMVCALIAGFASVASADDKTAVPYYRHPVMTMSGGAMTWTARLPSDWSSTVPLEFQTALSRHLQSIMRKDLVVDASVKTKAGWHEVKIELAEVAGLTVFPKGIEVFKAEKSCDENTTFVIEASAAVIEKLKDAQSQERKALDAQMLKFAKFAHWVPLSATEYDSKTVVQIADDSGSSKTSIKFDVMLAPELIEEYRQQIGQASPKLKTKSQASLVSAQPSKI